MLIILLFIIFCYSIMAVVLGLLSDPFGRRSLLWGLITLVGLNSTFNPVIYLTRMRDLRQACKHKLRRVLGFKRNEVSPREMEISQATTRRHQSLGKEESIMEELQVSRSGQKYSTQNKFYNYFALFAKWNKQLAASVSTLKSVLIISMTKAALKYC